jgi:hypothetical protein
MANSWYTYVGGKEDDPTNASNYIKNNGRHDCLCGHDICVIYTKDNGLYPADPLSNNIKLYIKTALATGQLQPAVPVTAKKYVYLK